jgi:hypothetical protein
MLDDAQEVLRSTVGVNKTAMIDNDRRITIPNNYDFSELFEISEFCPAVC